MLVCTTVAGRLWEAVLVTWAAATAFSQGVPGFLDLGLGTDE